MGLETPSWEAALGGSLDSKHNLIGEFETCEKPRLKTESKQAGLEEWLNIYEHYCSCRGPGLPSSRAPAGPGLLPQEHHQNSGFSLSPLRTRVHFAPAGLLFPQEHHQKQGSFCTSRTRALSSGTPAGPEFILEQHPSGPRFFFSSAVPAAHNHLQFWSVRVLV